jgi:hypothetical protein
MFPRFKNSERSYVPTMNRCLDEVKPFHSGGGWRGVGVSIRESGGVWRANFSEDRGPGGLEKAAAAEEKILEGS